MENLGDKIIAYESGELSETETIDLFAELNQVEETDNVEGAQQLACVAGVCEI